jgi:hypothetical protein
LEDLEEEEFWDQEELARQAELEEEWKEEELARLE